MIFTERTIMVVNDSATINKPLILYRGDKNIELKITIAESQFKFRNTDASNVIETTDASYAQLVINTPYNSPIFSDVAVTKNGAVIFVITEAMIDEIREVGAYEIQIRLLDDNKQSRASIPPVSNAIEIREPIAIEDGSAVDSNAVNVAKVNRALTTTSAPLEAFDSQGNYIKKTWGDGDPITDAALNKMEAGIDGVNKKIGNVRSQIKERATKQEVDVERKRIDNLTTLSEGSTTGDAELIDGRIGADGTIYPNIGEAIRTQYSNLSNVLLRKKTYSGNEININEVNGNCIITTDSETTVYTHAKNYLPFEISTADFENKPYYVEHGENYIVGKALVGEQYKNFNLKTIYLPAGTYILSRKVEVISGSATGNYGFIYVRNEDTNNYINALPITKDTEKIKLSTGTNISIQLQINMNGTITQDLTVKFSELQIEKGETATSYEQYKGEIKTGKLLNFKNFPNMSIYNSNNINMEANIAFSKEFIEKSDLDPLVKDIQDLKNNRTENTVYDVICWGDSLTNGTGNDNSKPSTETNTDCSYPAVLGRILGNKYTVINGGVGGETSWMIATRQGGMTIQVLPNTIPADTTPVRIYLKGQEQDYFYNADSKKWTYLKDNLSYNIAVDGNARINPCYINGIEGTLSRQLLSSGTADPTTGETVQTNTYAYYFTRKQAGEEYTFTTPRNLITYGSKNYKDCTNIIWMGQNDAPLHDGKYVTQIGTENRAKSMIEHLTHDRYIIMDLPSGDNVRSAERVQSFNQEFGKHYLNIREYICKYGVTMANELGANITVSDSDQGLINNGQIPSCLRKDGVHGNYWYYQIVARAVFEKGQDLGYW